MGTERRQDPLSRRVRSSSWRRNVPAAARATGDNEYHYHQKMQRTPIFSFVSFGQYDTAKNCHVRTDDTAQCGTTDSAVSICGRDIGLYAASRGVRVRADGGRSTPRAGPDVTPVTSRVGTQRRWDRSPAKMFGPRRDAVHDAECLEADLDRFELIGCGLSLAHVVDLDAAIREPARVSATASPPTPAGTCTTTPDTTEPLCSSKRFFTLPKGRHVSCSGTQTCDTNLSAFATATLRVAATCFAQVTAHAVDDRTVR